MSEPIGSVVNMISLLEKVNVPGTMEETLNHLTGEALKNIWTTYEFSLQGEDPQTLFTNHQRRKGAAKREAKPPNFFISHLEYEVRVPGEKRGLWERSEEGEKPAGHPDNQIWNQEKKKWINQFCEAVEKELELLLKNLIVGSLGLKFVEGPDGSGLHFGVKHRSHPQRPFLSRHGILKKI